ncbi:SPOR domain-containing protein [Paenibacillus eucommiae]|uniref:DUF4309 domain-containing protein n=1 Tax=Paenibacillus eucommiae TaxID=1355755 RepID=A0ABS4INT0_9BACL|nr:DUF4309 domain-containing protein [Paenibacillus eucommiae]MBP1989207.1 hypothetical protein [Paenibacillus eucommiae]
MMNKPWKLIGSGILPLALITLIASGCEDKPLAVVEPPTETTAPLQPQHSSQPKENEPIAAASTPSSIPTATPTINHEAHVSANETSPEDKAAKPSGTATPKPAAKPKVDEKDAYQEQKPTLMGLQLGSDKAAVLKRFGEAKNQFVMDEDADAITVFEYADFSVGFNVSNKLEFVDIHTTEIDPGLRGLRLGQKSEDAISILGKPDTNTTYVLSYKAQGTVLKLDIDPKENTIQSIKLFASH